MLKHKVAALACASMLLFQGTQIAFALPEGAEIVGAEVSASDYSEEDAKLLARLLWSECRGESREGQLMVAQCVLDRLAEGTWGDSLSKVIKAKGQFAELGKLDDELLEVAKAALEGERFDSTIKILYFCMPDRKNWHATWLGKVGCHNYYGEELKLDD